MTVSEKTDEEIVLACLDDKEAFAYIIERYEPKLRRYLSRITNVIPADVDDLLQDTFIKAYQNLHSFDADFAFSSWMYRIARNTAISDHRRRSSRPESLVLDDDEVFMQLSDESNIEQELGIREAGKHLRTIIPTLRDDYRDVIILRFFEGKGYDEISDILMKPPGTVATLLNRAKKELKRILSTKEYSDL